MFDQLFTCPRAIERHLARPLLQPRLDYLIYCEQQGAALSTRRLLAQNMLVISEYLHLQVDAEVCLEQILAAADQWISRHHQFHRPNDSRPAKVRFISDATRWLRFLGRLHVPTLPPSSHADLVKQFAAYMQQERGFSALTIRTRCLRVTEFLNRVCTNHRSLHELSITHIDEAIAQKGQQDGCARITIQAYASQLRAFLRYAESRGWCTPGLAEAIISPRVYKQELLPAGPSWTDVQRLLAGTATNRPTDIRDRALLLLFAVYGLRAGELRQLQLEDLNWEQERICITRPKQRRQQMYPFALTVGEAILRYLREVRARAPYREVFLSLKAPFQPLTNSALWQVVSRRLRPLDLAIKHHGPHALRHACATHLLMQGLSMKEIGDHLGHRSPAATQTYAKSVSINNSYNSGAAVFLNHATIKHGSSPPRKVHSFISGDG